MTIKDDEMVGAMHATRMAPVRNIYIIWLCKRKVMRCLRRSECRGEGVINPLTPNDLQQHRAVSPLKSRTTYIDVANSLSKFGGILFTPIRLTAVVY
jgi:hypothetical protein